MDINDNVKELLKYRNDIESSFLKIKDSDPGKARFYSLMLSEIDERIRFHKNAAVQRNFSRVLAGQKRANKNIRFLTRFFIFIMFLQLAVVLLLIALK